MQKNPWGTYWFRRTTCAKVRGTVGGWHRPLWGLLGRPSGHWEILQISSEQFRLPPWTDSDDWFMIASDLQNRFGLWSKALQEVKKERQMADEKSINQIVDKNELSEQELEQATGGVSAAAALNRTEGKRAEFIHENAHGRK